jgi:P4 family phage/plasmid primase-like protien
MTFRKGTSVVSAALAYKAQGWSPVPIRLGEKNPIGTAWQKQRLTPEQIPSHFRDGSHNIGLLLGAPSGNLVDIDLDVLEAVRLADFFLPPTAFIFGRKSNPRSHRFYRTATPWKTKQFKDPDGTMLVELRSTGGQTVVPPSVHPSGEHVEFDHEGEPPEVTGEALERAVSRLAAASLIARRWPKQGSRHQAALALAGGLLRAGGTVEETAGFVRAVASAAGDEEVEDRVQAVSSTHDRLEDGAEATGWPQLGELIGEDTVASVLKWLGVRSHRTQTSSLAEQHPDGQLAETRGDYGNARRFVRRHGPDLRYCHGRGWLVWDGRRWAADDSGEVVRRAKDTVRNMAAEAAALDDHARILLLKHALASENVARIKAMISLAESEASVSVTPGQLDTDPFLLNVMNGTIDLRTGELRPHRREDLITKLAPVAYDPDATLPEWDAFLDTVTGGDPQLMAYLQRVVGYCLTGDTSEEKFFFIHGPGATGKSTFVEAMKRMMGDYAMTADFDTFLARANSGGARNDIARLQGARFVTATEVDEGSEFAHSLLKQMTGRDKVTARFLYREPFEFYPQCKLLLVANHAPRVRPNDHATWRRIARVPFLRVLLPAERDPHLKEILCDPTRGGPAILAWAVRGGVAWRVQGLGSCTAVDDSTASYHAEMDTVQRFIDDCCVVAPKAKANPSDLYDRYTLWCEEAGVEAPLGKSQFAGALQIRGFLSVKGTNGARYRQGIGLRNREEPIEEAYPTNKQAPSYQVTVQ